jgi:hypothetical protein
MMMMMMMMMPQLAGRSQSHPRNPTTDARLPRSACQQFNAMPRRAAGRMRNV